MVSARVRYFAGAAERAGVDEEDYQTVRDLTDLQAQIVGRHGHQISALLHSCSFLLEGELVTDPHAPFTGQIKIDVLPPFAGG